MKINKINTCYPPNRLNISFENAAPNTNGTGIVPNNAQFKSAGINKPSSIARFFGNLYDLFLKLLKASGGLISPDDAMTARSLARIRQNPGDIYA